MPSPERSANLTPRPVSPEGTVWGRLLKAATDRFPEPDFEVSCDDRHTVWVKRADGRRSVGLSQWGLRRYTLEEMLDDAEAKLTTGPAKVVR